MSWDYRLEDSAKADLRNLGPSFAGAVRAFLDGRIRGSVKPTQFGKPLRGALKGFWRYRVRDYRILCRLEKSILVIIVVEVGYRSTVYDD